jgi:maltose O-acetyltransferase
MLGFDDVPRVVREEIRSLQPGWLALTFALRTLPEHSFSRLRTQVLRSNGWSIGRNTLLFGLPKVSGDGCIRDRLTIGELTFINVGCTFELNDQISIGRSVAIGHEVMLLTSTHRMGRRNLRAGSRTTAPIVIEDGAWIGSRSLILPGVTIGAGAVVAAGSVVSRDVAPNSLVAGAPAVLAVRRLPG